MRLRVAAVAAVSAFLAVSALGQGGERSARQGLDAMTKRFAAAYKGKDLDTLRRELTADFRWKRPDGTSIPVDKAMEGLKNQLDRVLAVDDISIVLDHVLVIDRSATALAHCTFTGKVSDGAGGVRKVTSRSKYRYQWVKTDKGWRIKSIEDLNGWDDSAKSVNKG
jgi:hypothetical protein